ncbi:hypothetical protein FPZ12_022225 [Amycolatopsis acidicola]|uniref:Uncharacterized protein n=1 Tax=Amycolatopsis acidicola TaxID=2596893 RepID=A0A5N0UY31_9PSEU|nr:hypothetical protein [Amycolatopsis acidicola]KAA9158561.1 hypothetical protein FPZ12_022225 [Amycolatopsis acidicola]
MIRLAVVLIGLSVLFSVMGFKDGNVFVGVVFALLALSPLLYLAYFSATRGNEPRKPAGKQRTLVLRLVAVGLVAVLGYGVYWVFAAPKSSDQALERASDLEAGCYGSGGRKYFPDTAGYTGSGPHPIVMFDHGEADDVNQMHPDTGVADYWSGDDLDPHDVQLIACLDAPDDGQYLTDCDFNGDSLKLYQGEYDFTVYEAKTGKEVGSGEIAGSTNPDCPFSALVPDNGDRIHTDPDFADYQSALGRYVN